VSGLERVFIPSKVQDNKFLGDDYVARLRASGGKELVRAWLEGDWSVIEGAFFDNWSMEKHVVRPFSVPEGLDGFRSADWGSARPFSVGWWAIVGDDFKLKCGGKVHDLQSLRLTTRGAGPLPRMVRGSSPNVGLKLTAEQVAAGIIEREPTDQKVNYGVIDPATFSEDGGPSIAERINNALNRAGLVAFHKADNARVTQRGAMGGWDQMRSRLHGIDDRPMIYTFSTCLDSIRTIPALQHDKDKPEDLDTDGEDHAADEWRYACMSRPWMPPIKSTDKPKNPSGYRSTRTSGRMIGSYLLMALETSYTSRGAGSGTQGGSGQAQAPSDYWQLSKVRRCYTDYLTSKREELDEQIDSRRYYHGSQWTTEQIRVMKTRKQPVMTFNRVARKIDGVVGLIERLRQDPKAYPRTPKHEEGAELATAAVRYVLDEQEWKAKSPQSAQDGAVDGIGGIEIELRKATRATPRSGLNWLTCSRSSMTRGRTRRTSRMPAIWASASGLTKTLPRRCSRTHRRAHLPPM
jgi:hypothetical protein